MNWTLLTTKEQFKDLVKNSHYKPQVIFKHSTRCSISSVAKTRLEKSGVSPHIDFYFLDLLAHRSLSDQVACDLRVKHESPQVLLIQNGECTFDESHLGIRMEHIMTEVV